MEVVLIVFTSVILGTIIDGMEVRSLLEGFE